MPLPSAVQKKVDRAHELMKGDASPQPAPAPAPSPATPPRVAATGEDVATLRASLEEATRNLTAANSRYTVLQGKFNAENPQLKQQVKDLEQQVRDLTEKLNRKFESGELSSLSDEDRRLVGDDMVKVFSKVAREVASGEFDGRIKPITDSVASLQQQTEVAYFATLDHLVPGWEQQNEEPNFIAWLQEVDLASGALRFDLVKRAERGRQGYRVAEIFKAFREKREIGAQAPSAPAPKPNIDPPEGGGGGNPPLEGDQGKIWKQSEIRAFYNDKRTRKYIGKEDEARAIEADILAAGREGRVRTG